MPHSTFGKTNIKRGYSINSSVIVAEEVMKDLGVWVDCTLKFSKHIFYISSSANSSIGLFKKTFLCITTVILKNCISFSYVQNWNMRVVYGHQL